VVSLPAQTTPTPVTTSRSGEFSDDLLWSNHISPEGSNESTLYTINHEIFLSNGADITVNAYAQSASIAYNPRIRNNGALYIQNGSLTSNALRVFILSDRGLLSIGDGRSAPDTARLIGTTVSNAGINLLSGGRLDVHTGGNLTLAGNLWLGVAGNTETSQVTLDGSGTASVGSIFFGTAAPGTANTTVSSLLTVKDNATLKASSLQLGSFSQTGGNASKNDVLLSGNARVTLSSLVYLGANNSTISSITLKDNASLTATDFHVGEAAANKYTNLTATLDLSGSSLLTVNTLNLGGYALPAATDATNTCIARLAGTSIVDLSGGATGRLSLRNGFENLHNVRLILAEHATIKNVKYFILWNYSEIAYDITDETFSASIQFNPSITTSNVNPTARIQIDLSNFRPTTPTDGHCTLTLISDANTTVKNSITIATICAILGADENACILDDPTLNWVYDNDSQLYDLQLDFNYVAAPVPEPAATALLLGLAALCLLHRGRGVSHKEHSGLCKPLNRR
jgi:hypothetical protein